MTPDLSAITTGMAEFGGVIFEQHVNEFNPTNFRVLRNVTLPQLLPRISDASEPRPYTPGENYDTDIAFADRLLTVYQSKRDIQIDPEKYRNTYLALVAQGKTDIPFYSYLLDVAVKQYLSKINDKTLYNGVYNGAGTGALDIATGIGTIIANEITASHLVPIVTGALSNTTAVSKVETLAGSVPDWMREMGFTIFCSFASFDLYKQDYRTRYTYKFEPDQDGNYHIDGFNQKCILQPVSWLKGSGRLIATIDGNLCMGTDGESLAVWPTPFLNTMKIRLMMPIGFQIAALADILVNDVA